MTQLPCIATIETNRYHDDTASAQQYLQIAREEALTSILDQLQDPLLIASRKIQAEELEYAIEDYNNNIEAAKQFVLETYNYREI